MRFVSNSAIGAILTAVAGLIAGTFMLEIYLVNAYSWGHTYGPPIASCINVLQIEVVSRIAVVRFSRFLTFFENHRTETEYEDSLIIKVMIFETTNSYAALFWIGFLAERYSDICTTKDECARELLVYLTLHMMSKCFAQNVSEVLKPKLIRVLKRWGLHASEAKPAAGGAAAAAAAAPDVILPAESEWLMSALHPVTYLIDDYRELAIIFGYITIFTVVFPIGPLIALLGFMIEARAPAPALLSCGVVATLAVSPHSVV